MIQTIEARDVRDVHAAGRATLFDLMLSLGHVSPDSTPAQVDAIYQKIHANDPSYFQGLARGAVQLVLEHEP